jgi:phage protein D
MTSPSPTLRVARPAIKVDGQTKAELAGGLQSMLVEETTDGLYRCELTLFNWGAKGGEIGYLYFDRQLLDFGKSISVETAATGDPGTVFSGRIMGLEARCSQSQTPQITVLAEDRLQDLRMTRRTRSFEQMSDEDAIRQIASQHSLQAQIELDGSPVTHRILAQVNQSDLAFLRERARAIGAEVWAADQTLYVKSRSHRSSADVTLTYGQNLVEFTVLADLAGQRTSFTAVGWDPGAKEAVSHEATAQAISGEASGGTSGPALLQQKLGERKEQLVHLTPASAAEARVLAEAAYRKAARRFVTGTAMTDGDPKLQVGQTVDMKGLGPMFDGKYYIAEARHLFDMNSGYRTQIRVERPWIGD